MICEDAEGKIVLALNFENGTTQDQIVRRLNSVHQHAIDFNRLRCSAIDSVHCSQDFPNDRN